MDGDEAASICHSHIPDSLHSKGVSGCELNVTVIGNRVASKVKQASFSIDLDKALAGLYRYSMDIDCAESSMKLVANRRPRSSKEVDFI